MPHSFSHTYINLSYRYIIALCGHKVYDSGQSVRRESKRHAFARFSGIDILQPAIDEVIAHNLRHFIPDAAASGISGGISLQAGCQPEGGDTDTGVRCDIVLA